MSEKPFTYEQCSGCTAVSWMWSKNERGFCSGIIKDPKPKCDVLRFCLLDNKDSDYVDLRVAEALDMSAVLAAVASEYLRKVKKSPLW